MRKAIQITTIQDTYGRHKLVALCDDGTIWVYDDMSWTQTFSIPRHD